MFMCLQLSYPQFKTLKLSIRMECLNILQLKMEGRKWQLLGIFLKNSVVLLGHLSVPWLYQMCSQDFTLTLANFSYADCTFWGPNYIQD